MFRGVAIAVSSIVFVSRASFADVVAGPRSSVAIRVSVAALVGEVASDAAAVDVSAVDTVRGGDGVGGIGEGDEGAPARAAGVVVRDDLHGQHLAVALENITHGALVGGKSEPADEHRGGGGVGCARRARRARRARGPGAPARGVAWRSMPRINAKGAGTGTVLARIDVHLVQARLTLAILARVRTAASRAQHRATWTASAPRSETRLSFPRVSSSSSFSIVCDRFDETMNCTLLIFTNRSSPKRRAPRPSRSNTSTVVAILHRTQEHETRADVRF